jgi:hypothetical protein
MREDYPLPFPLRAFFIDLGVEMGKQRNAEKLAEAKAERKEIKTAISMILGGAQSYSIGTRSLTRADLATLYKRKNMLDDLVDALSGGNGRFRRVIPVG